MFFILAFFIWRIYLFIVTYLVSTYFLFTPRFPYSQELLISSKLPQWLWAFANFDGVHYLTIAKTGYSAQFTQVFFPLYPLLIRVISFVFFDKFQILTGITLSFVLFFIAIYFLNKLLKLDYEEKTVKKTIIFLVLFPTAFYFSCLYTESLFFLLTILSFWCVRNKKWWLAGIFGALAAATRITGILLLPALLWEWIIYKNKFVKLSLKNILNTTLYGLYTPLSLIPLGLVSYMVYLWVKFNNPLYFINAQSVFGAQRLSGGLVFPLQTVWRYLKIFFTVSVNNLVFWNAVSELASFLLIIILLIIAHKKKIRLSYLIFSWLLILIPSLTGTFSSMPRYILLVFPMYIVFGLIKNKWISLGLLLFFMLLQTIFLSVFIKGLWVA